MSEHRYPLIAYLDPPLTDKIRQIQAIIRDLSSSQAAMRDWDPHISLGSEAWIQDDKLNAYESELRRAVSDYQPFKATVRDFGFIDNWSGGNLPGNSPYGIFLHVDVTPELRSLAAAVEAVASKHKLYFTRPQPYLPHVTLAFRDLNRDGYLRAKSALEGQQFNEQTAISGISLARVDPSGRNAEAVRIPLA